MQKKQGKGKGLNFQAHESLRKQPPVQNSEDYLDERIAKLSDKDPLTEAPRQGGIPPGTRQRCTRQVYATMEVAELSVVRLNKLNIPAKIERCKFCGMLHIQELR